MRYSPETISQLLDRVDMLDLVRNYVDGLENRAGPLVGLLPLPQ